MVVTQVTWRFHANKVMNEGLKIWRDPEVAQIAVTEALRILERAYELKPLFFAGRSTRGVLGGLFYLIGKRYGRLPPKTQWEIAYALNVTEVTIRESAKRWLSTFPFLFDKTVTQVTDEPNH